MIKEELRGQNEQRIPKKIRCAEKLDLLKKTDKFVVRPKPGAHPQKISMPLALLIRQLGYAQTTREIKSILNTKEMLVDGRRIKDHRFPVGFMDIISITASKENFRILLDCKGKLSVNPIKDEKEAGMKLCRIKDKKVIKKGKMQLNMSGNRNIIMEKGDYKPGDSILIEVPSQKILQHIKLEKGSHIFITGGTRVGSKGVVESIEGDKIIYSADNETRNTLKKYAFAIGKDKEIIGCPESYTAVFLGKGRYGATG